MLGVVQLVKLFQRTNDLVPIAAPNTVTKRPVYPFSMKMEPVPSVDHLPEKFLETTRMNMTWDVVPFVGNLPGENDLVKPVAPSSVVKVACQAHLFTNGTCVRMPWRTITRGSSCGDCILLLLITKESEKGTNR